MNNITSYKYPFKNEFGKNNDEPYTVEEIIEDTKATFEKLLAYHKSEINKIEFMMRTDFETNAAGNENLSRELEKHKQMIGRIESIKL